MQLGTIETGSKYRHDGIMKQFKEVDKFAH